MAKHAILYVAFCQATGEFVTIGDELNFCPTYKSADAIRFESQESAGRLAKALSAKWGRTFVVVPQIS